MSIADPPEYDEANLTSEERNYRAAVARWYADEGAYEHQQMTRPATLSYGLSDSPVGLLAWLLEKYHAWYGAFSDDEILTQASLYWHTGTIATSSALLGVRPGQGRASPLGRSADRHRCLPQRSVAAATQLGPADLQRGPVHPDATRRPLRTPSRDRTTRGRHNGLLQVAALIR